MIHHQDCGHCRSGHGKLSSLSNKNGFWAGPFNTIIDTEDSLKNLLKLVEYKFTYITCNCCKNKTNP